MFRHLVLVCLTCAPVLRAFAQDDRIGEPVQEAGRFNPSPSAGSRAPRCLDVRPPPSGQIGRRALADIDDDEILARLIYAETLAARCPHENSRIAPGIAAVIMNRIKDFKVAGSPQPVQHVVFGRDMFASSLKSYSASQWKSFICPTKNQFDENLYAQSKALVKSPAIKNLYPEATHYYLHQHFGSYTNQPWGSKAVLKKALGTKAGQVCLGIYRETKSYLNARLVE